MLNSTPIARACSTNSSSLDAAVDAARTSRSRTRRGASMVAIACPAIALRVVAQVTLQATDRAGLAALLGLAPMGWLLWPLLAVLLPRMGEAALATAIGAAALLAGLGGAAVIARTLLLPLRRAGHPA